MKIVPVPVREDNYAYLLIDEATKTAAAVDPYDVPKVEAAAKAEGVRLVSLLTTHHHHDHAGGNEKFASTFPAAPIYGGSEEVAAVTHIVKDGELLTLGDTVHIKCIATPCHTRDSICYHVTSTSPGTDTEAGPGGVFTGDTLFVGGCGRFFEGTAPQMKQALARIGALPGQTRVYPGHEYTAGNVAFAAAVEPGSAGVEGLQAVLKEHGRVVGTSTVAQEKEWNVFMRLGTAAVRKWAGVGEGASDEEVMDKLRDGKNNFRG